MRRPTSCGVLALAQHQAPRARPSCDLIPPEDVQSHVCLLPWCLAGPWSCAVNIELCPAEMRLHRAHPKLCRAEMRLHRAHPKRTTCKSTRSCVECMGAWVYVMLAW
eukprot:361960-Chlamydomonas_euryale.AAC.2